MQSIRFYPTVKTPYKIQKKKQSYFFNPKFFFTKERPQKRDEIQGGKITGLEGNCKQGLYSFNV
jgi:hypothetical protein